MKDLSFTRHKIGELHLHLLPVEKFKTNLISVHIHLPLKEETVTRAALLPNVMQRGCLKYPDMAAIQKHLNNLYGAELNVEVSKKGEIQYIAFQIEVLNEQFISDHTPLLEKAFAFLGEMIFSPLVEGEGFSQRYMDLEKESLTKKIEGLIDDKMRYANQRLTEEMCKDEPFRLLPYGVTEKIPEISPENLYEFYKDLLANYPMDVYLVGDFSPEQGIQLAETYFSKAKGKGKGTVPTELSGKEIKEKIVKEEMDVSQGKLNMGLRTQIRFADEEYIPLLMYNGVLGGFPHSKLFTNVREKASLAYYAVSRLESSKGLLMIMSGIESDNFDRAVAIIKEQLKMMEEGDITDLEIQQTKAALSNQYQESYDHVRALIDFDYLGQLNGKVLALKDIIQGVEKVNKDQIVQVAKNIKVDTIYFLQGKGEQK